MSIHFIGGQRGEKANGIVFDAAALPAGVFELLRVEVGSTAHGIGTGDDDTDEMGVCIEPPDCVIGLNAFEQYEYRTAWDRVDGGADRYTQPQPTSEAGDRDVVIYSLRKWCSMALSGNPTALLLLFAPILKMAPMASALRSPLFADLFYSERAGTAFLEYMRKQRTLLVLNAEQIDVRNFSAKHWKLAAQVTRLGIQGCEYVRSRRLTLPMEEMHRDVILAIRRGEVALTEILETALRREKLLTDYMTDRPMAPEPDRADVNAFLVSIYRECWTRNS